MAKVKKVYKYKDWLLDSQGEQDFCYYLQELQDNGFIDKFSRPIPVKLSEPLVNTYTQQLKTKTKECKETIMLGHEYTWDFGIHWTKKGLKYFCSIYGEKMNKPFIASNVLEISHIELKPSFDFNNMERLVKINIKWVFDKFGIYIQIIKPDTLFKETFTPNGILWTKTGKKRVFKWEVRSLQDYIKLQEQ